MRKNKKTGFSLVEIVVVIAVLAVLIAVLAPALLTYVEKSRIQKDESAMGEVVNAAQISLSDVDAFDEAYSYAINDNYTGYKDSEGGNTIDEQYWAASGSSNKTMTITFYPEGNGTYNVGNGVINDMSKGRSVAEKKSTNDVLLKDLRSLYPALKQTIGETLKNTSATYRNSDYTLFIVFELGNGMNKANVYGEFNGTNLSDGADAAPGEGDSCHWNTWGSVHKCSVHQEQHNPDWKLKPHNEGGDGNTYVCKTCGIESKDITADFVQQNCKHENVEQIEGDSENHKCTDCDKEIPHDFTNNGNCECGKQQATVSLGAGLYDANDGLIAAWDDIQPQIFIETDYTGSGRKAEGAQSAYKVITSNYPTATKIVIPEGITHIGAEQFDGCSQITEIVLPSTLKTIGIWAFQETGISTIDIPNGTTDIGKGGFYQCANLDSVIIPKSVTSIGEKAFYFCTSLNSVTIPDSVTSIGDWAFAGIPTICYSGSATGSPWGAKENHHITWQIPCNQTVYCPYCNTELGYGRKHDCKNDICQVCNAKINGFFDANDKLIMLWEDSGADISIDYTYSNFDKSSTSPYKIITDYNNANASNPIKKVIIPDGVTSIGTYAFGYCNMLTSVTIPNSVTSIGTYAFYECSSLTSVTIPNSVTSIGGSAFYHCCSLTSVTISNSVTSIDGMAFYDCDKLTSIEIPDSVTSIGRSAFMSCGSLNSVTIPDSVTSIDIYAFRDCASLTSVTIPDSITSISNYIFFNCTSLTSVTIPNSVTSIGERVFYYCSKLTSISFNGTQTQWNRITKGSDWKGYVPTSCVVHCTNSCVNLSGTQITCPAHGTAGTQG